MMVCCDKRRKEQDLMLGICEMVDPARGVDAILSRDEKDPHT